MPALDPQLRDLLATLRGRVRRYIVADGLLALVAVTLSAFWIGLAIDFLPVRLGGTEMPRSARTVLLVVVGVTLLILFARLLVGRLRRPLPDDSLALLIERHHPELGGRLVTAVQLTQGHRHSDSHAPDLLRKVHAEAAEAVGGVNTGRVFRWEPLRRKAGLVLPLSLATVLFAMLSPDAFARAAGRLLLLTDSPWPRQARLEMIGIELPAVSADESDAPPPRLMEFENRLVRLPRGSSGTLRIAAAAEDGAIVPDVCTVYFTTAGGSRGQANLRRVGRVTDGWQTFLLDGPPLAGLSESVTLNVRGLDARLDDYKIEAVEPPALSRLQVTSIDPPYLQPLAADGSPTDQPISRQVDYQAGLRIREGARATLTARSSVPLGNVDARMLIAGEPVESPSVSLAEDGSEFSLAIDDVRRPATIIVVPEDRDGISAQVPYRYFLGVVTDEKPEVEMRLRGIGTAVTPDARIPLAGRATDDYEIATAMVTLSAVGAATDAVTDTVNEEDAAQSNEAAGETIEDPQPNGDVKKPAAAASTTLPLSPGRSGDFELLVDLRELAASQPATFPRREPGSAINLIAEATDRYDLDGRSHRTLSQLFRLEIVTPENLLALLERRELALRARLEQAIEETRLMRDSLVGLTGELESFAAAREAEPAPTDPADPSETTDGTGPSEGTGPADPDDQAARESVGEVAAEVEPQEDSDTPDRSGQILRLRTQQIGLQATKAGEELQGIATSLDDLLEEMANNRVDSVDRSERIGGGVRDPLREVITGDLAKLVEQISTVEKRVVPTLPIPEPSAAEVSASAVQTAEQVLLQLTAILDKMLDLESYNEILDMVRELIDNQDKLIEETKQEQKRRVLDLFD